MIQVTFTIKDSTATDGKRVVIYENYTGIGALNELNSDHGNPAILDTVVKSVPYEQSEVFNRVR